MPRSSHTEPSRNNRYEKRRNPDGEWEVEYVASERVVLQDVTYGDIEVTVDKDKLGSEYRKVS